MVAISYFPKGYDPGHFFILFSGVFFTLKNFASLDFCRLRMHGGTAPTSTGEDMVEWADIVVVVSYSPNGQTQGNQCYALGGMPDNSTFFISPEMTQ